MSKPLRLEVKPLLLEAIAHYFGLFVKFFAFVRYHVPSGFWSLTLTGCLVFHTRRLLPRPVRRTDESSSFVRESLCRASSQVVVATAGLVCVLGSAAGADNRISGALQFSSSTISYVLLAVIDSTGDAGIKSPIASLSSLIKTTSSSATATTLSVYILSPASP
ncbi:hypothetical protein J6590_086195 [Homalodisca vitripennis]|nr:hypothetical protein J6590_086195 [Homalodisca vitripennis]